MAHKKRETFSPSADGNHRLRVYCSACNWQVQTGGRHNDIKAMYAHARAQFDAHVAPLKAAERAKYESQLRARAATSKSKKTPAQLEASDNAWGGLIAGIVGLVVLGLIVWGIVALNNMGSSSKCGRSPDAEPGSAQYERDLEKTITGDC